MSRPISEPDAETLKEYFGGPREDIREISEGYFYSVIPKGSLLNKIFSGMTYSTYDSFEHGSPELPHSLISLHTHAVEMGYFEPEEIIPILQRLISIRSALKDLGFEGRVEPETSQDYAMLFQKGIPDGQLRKELRRILVFCEQQGESHS